MITVTQIQEYLDTHDKGVLKTGGHSRASGEYCALECIAQLRDQTIWTDSPEAAQMPDVRPLNDGPWPSDVQRTETMLPMLAALSRWPEWTRIQQQQWVQQVILRTVQEIISELPRLPEALRRQCRQSQSLQEAEAAAAESAAELAAKSVAAWAAESAAESAAWAAGAAAWAAESAAAELAAKSAAELAAKSVAAGARAAAWSAKSAVSVLWKACLIWQQCAEEIQ